MQFWATYSEPQVVAWMDTYFSKRIQLPGGYVSKVVGKYWSSGSLRTVNHPSVVVLTNSPTWLSEPSYEEATPLADISVRTPRKWWILSMHTNLDRIIVNMQTIFPFWNTNYCPQQLTFTGVLALNDSMKYGEAFFEMNSSGFSGYFDPINIFFNDENKYFSGWPNQRFCKKGSLVKHSNQGNWIYACISAVSIAKELQASQLLRKLV